MEGWDIESSFLLFQISYTVGYLCGHFKELRKIMKELGKKHQIHPINTKQPIIVREKMESLDEKIELGLNLCKLMRYLDEIGNVTVAFFW